MIATEAIEGVDEATTKTTNVTQPPPAAAEPRPKHRRLMSMGWGVLQSQPEIQGQPPPAAAKGQCPYAQARKNFGMFPGMVDCPECGERVGSAENTAAAKGLPTIYAILGSDNELICATFDRDDTISPELDDRSTRVVAYPPPIDWKESRDSITEVLETSSVEIGDIEIFRLGTRILEALGIALKGGSGG